MPLGKRKRAGRQRERAFQEYIKARRRKTYEKIKGFDRTIAGGNGYNACCLRLKGRE
jgi:hypothetical protein